MVGRVTCLIGGLLRAAPLRVVVQVFPRPWEGGLGLLAGQQNPGAAAHLLHRLHTAKAGRRGVKGTVWAGLFVQGPVVMW